MEDHQYNLPPDLRHYRQIFTAIPPAPQPQPPTIHHNLAVDLFSGHHHHQSLAQQQYEMSLMRGRGGLSFHPQNNNLHLIGSACDNININSTNNNSTTSNNTTSGASGGGGGVGLEMESGAGGGSGVGGGNGRWPRQETLTLLEIRSNLDSKFKEANQKGPLWDEVSRIMSDEHGYQRSGKKCREKFENLYKYYKKTKEGKAGRQDGKHYRFFRQLEALYGESSNQTYANDTNLVGNINYPYNINMSSKMPINQDHFQSPPHLCGSLSLSNSSGFINSSSSESDDVDGDNDDIVEKRRKRKGVKRSWKVKIKEFIDGQMRKLMDKQEVWLDKVMTTIESKEQERTRREEEWRIQEAARIDREHKFWAQERAWIEARDASLIDALNKLTGKESRKDDDTINYGINTNNNAVDSGADRVISNYVAKMKEGMLIRRRNENARGGISYNFESEGGMGNSSQDGGGFCGREGEITANDDSGRVITHRENSSVHVGGSSSTSGGMHDSCFRFYAGDGGNLWENYGLKHNKGEN